MSKKTLIAIIIGAVVVLGGGYLVVKNKMGGMNSAKLEALKSASKKISFSEFIKGHGSYQCNVTQSVNGTDTTGKVYLTKGLLRGEFASQVRGVNVDTNFIVRDGYTYTWTSMMPRFGMKIAVDTDSLKQASTSTQTSGDYAFNADKIGDYTCEAWTVDETKFTLPSTVTFREINR